MPKNKHSNSIVLPTKIRKPPTRNQFVKRHSLINRLESNLTLPLTLISANTGFGKSTIASQWLDQTQHRYGWLSLDEEHNQPEILLAYLTKVLQQNWPEKEFDLAYLNAATRLPPSLISATLVSDLDKLEEPFILVLDDYHLITEPDIHEIINGILVYPPAQFHLVIITQIDPPLKLARLRAQFRIHELRMNDLVFSKEEAMDLRLLISKTASDTDVLTLHNIAEGWPTGLIAGLLGLKEGVSIEKVEQVFRRKGSIISDLLEEVVLKGLPSSTIKYLELTALLDRFSEDLLKVMIDAAGDEDLRQLSPAELIRNSRRRNLFLIPLDSTGQWYRYHHFFKNQIANLIGKNFQYPQINKLNMVASAWFEEQGLLEEAFSYAIKSADEGYAIALFSRHRHELLNTEQLQRLYRLSRLFPVEVVKRSAELMINLAMLQHYNANFTEMRQYLLQAESILMEQSFTVEKEKQLWGEFHGVSTYLSYMRGEFNEAINHGQKSMELLPADVPNFFREQSAGWYAFAQQASGNGKTGLARLEQEYSVLATTNLYFKMRLLQGKLIFNLFEGNIKHLHDDGASLTQTCKPDDYPGSWVIGAYSMAYHSYLQNKLDNVTTIHYELKKYRYACRPFWVIHHFFLECLSGIARKSWQKVEECMTECEELAVDLGIEPLKGMVNAFRVEYYLRRNDLVRAQEHAAMANFEPQPPTFFYYIPQLTRIKILFKTHKQKEGRELLGHLLETGRARHNKNLIIQALALQTSVDFESGNNESSLSSLEELLSLTDNTGQLRTFLDYGAMMEDMLRKAEKVTSYKKQVAVLLEAFKHEMLIPSYHGVKGGADHLESKPELSKRETEILALVARGYKNEEIAERLFVSLDTIKKHLYRAYQKLQVNNRVTAIKKAQSLGLLK